MITEQQEANLANHRAKTQQDKKHPFVINIEDGRLMPNVQALRKHKSYVVYRGDVHASLPERMRWLRGERGTAMILGLDSDEFEEKPPFDLSKATLEDLVAFAASGEAGFTMMLDAGKGLKAVRKEFIAAVKAHMAATEPAGAEDMT